MSILQFTTVEGHSAYVLASQIECVFIGALGVTTQCTYLRTKSGQTILIKDEIEQIVSRWKEYIYSHYGTRDCPHCGTLNANLHYEGQQCLGCDICDNKLYRAVKSM